MEKSVEIIKDLIRINNDRIKGYEKATEQTTDKDADLRVAFTDMAAESRILVNELRDILPGLGQATGKDTTMSGDIYRAWMDIKAGFTGKDRKSILASCEFGEDAAQKAYDKALNNAELSGKARQVATEQKARLKQSHDKIKRMRDSQPA